MIEINLVAERMRQRRFAELLQRVAAFACLFFFVAAVSSILWVWQRGTGMQRDIQHVQSELHNAELRKQQLDELKAHIATKEPLVSLLLKARSSESRVCTILRDVADAVPERVAIDNVQTSDRLHPRVTVEGKPEDQDRPGVTISGVAASNTLVGEFMARLGRAPSFQETFLSYAQQNKVEGRMQYSFEIIAICSEGA